MNCFVRLSEVYLDLPIGSRSIGTLFQRPADSGDDARIVRKGGAQVCQTLKDVSLEIHSGERVGLIGSNGAGKTSLLRVLAGIYAPTRGRYESGGDISTLFAATVGMEDNASGRENIFLAGRTLGFSRAQISGVTEDIISFAELGEFIDHPIRLYSAGMKTRLGFAIATAIQPEIVLIDEVFGAGDINFYKKANERIRRIIESAGIIVLASHSPTIIGNNCDRVIWVDQGEIRFDGDTDEGLRHYSQST